MLCRSYLTGIPTYRSFAEIPQRLFDEAVYFGADSARPMLGGNGERVHFFQGLWEDGVNDRVVLFVSTEQVRHPSFDRFAYLFNAVTGQVIGRGASLLDVPNDGGNTFGEFNLLRGFQKDAQDNFWGVWATGEVRRLTITAPNYLVQIQADTVQMPTRFGLIAFSVFSFDIPRDIALVSGPVFGRASRELSVYRFGSGEFLYGIKLPREGLNITHVSGTVVIVLLDDGSTVSLDYAAQRVFQHTRLPVGALQVNAQENLISWSKKYNRLLYVQKTPDDPTSGNCTIKVQGFRNIPIATHACKPVPLKPARAGRETPVLVKQIGDLGEGIAGSALVEPADYLSAAIVTTTAVPLDGDGEGVCTVLGTAEGTGELDVIINVACTVAAPDITNPLLAT